jgi:hypothetical protein
MPMNQAEITADELLAALKEAGCDATRGKLQRWHFEDVIPRPRQQSLGQGLGSVSFYPAICVGQAQRVCALLKMRYSFEDIGWLLWWEGYDVHEKHWKPRIENDAKRYTGAVQTLRNWIRQYEDSDAPENTNFFRLAQSAALRAEPLNRVIQFMDDDERETFVRMISHMITGSADAFQYHDKKESGLDLRVMVKALGLLASGRDVALGEQIELIPHFMNVIIALTNAPPLPASRKLFEGEGLTQLLAARDQLRDALVAIGALYRAVRPFYGKGAFGLRLGGWFAENAMNSELKGVLPIIWMQLLAASNPVIKSAVELMGMRVQAELSEAMSSKIQNLAQKTQFREILTPKKIAVAMSDATQLQVLLSEIRSAVDGSSE